MPAPERFEGLAGIPGLVHAVTTRASGDMSAARREDRERLARDLGFARLVTGRQVHGARLATLGDGGRLPPDGCDGLIVDRPGVLAGVLGADCPGVLLVDPPRGVLAVVHAGWRGVAAGVVPAAIALLRAAYRVEASGLYVGIGPGIGAARYEVSQEVAERIRGAIPQDAHQQAIRAGQPGHAYVDLRAAIRGQLRAAGVDAARIEAMATCTFDDERFFSYRRDGPETGRHALVAGWRA